MWEPKLFIQVHFLKKWHLFQFKWNNKFYKGERTWIIRISGVFWFGSFIKNKKYVQVLASPTGTRTGNIIGSLDWLCVSWRSCSSQWRANLEAKCVIYERKPLPNNIMEGRKKWSTQTHTHAQHMHTHTGPLLHTHRHAYTLTHTHSHRHTRGHTLIHIDTLRTHSYRYTHSWHTDTFTQTHHMHTHIDTHSHTCRHTYTLTRTLSHRHAHSQKMLR